MKLKIVAVLERAPFKFCHLDYFRAVNDCTETPIIRSVEISKLLTPQGDIDFEIFNRDHLRGLKTPAIQNLDDLPVVVKVSDHYILLDGTHRATIASREGKKSLKCYVFDRPHWYLTFNNSIAYVHIVTVESAITKILEMYEMADDKQAQVFNQLVGSTACLSWEDFDQALRKMSESQIFALEVELSGKFEEDEDGLIEKF